MDLFLVQCEACAIVADVGSYNNSRQVQKEWQWIAQTTLMVLQTNGN